MAQAPTSPTTNTHPEPLHFTLKLAVPEIQALLAVVGLTRGNTLYPLYQSLEDFHEAHGIERREVAEEHDIRGFDEDTLVAWGTASEACASTSP